MEEVKLKTVTIRGRSCDIYVNDKGEFFSVVEGTQLDAPTLPELEQKITRHTKIELNIPFSRQSNYDRWDTAKAGYPITIKHGRIVSVNAQNNNLMVRWDGEKGRPTQESRSAQYLKLTLEEEGIFLELIDQEISAKKRLQDFKDAHAIDVRMLEKEAAAAE